ncbi:aminotransferase class V-fold PLP-dependent enzyme [Mollicutes bacterium LVI A0039]|nr:aminotransferase class V-fold PLP-dependent enzyme [Mollicutes bacterium LVI A0039]
MEQLKYFDYAATTPIDESVYEVYRATGEECFFNSGCNKLAKELETYARTLIMESLDLDQTKHDLVFTSGGTESNNLAILGFAKTLTKSAHFITSCFEHASVNSCFVELENAGHSVTYIPVDSKGHINISDVIDSINDDTVMISIMLVNNELGTRQPIEELFEIVKRDHSHIVTMTDYVQGLGKLAFDHTNVDLFTISSHKIYGPKGVGALLKTKSTPLRPLLVGGTNEGNMRAGLQSLPAQVAFAASVKKVVDNFEANNRKIAEVQEHFHALVDQSPVLTLNCKPQGNVSSIRLDSKEENDEILEMMENEGFFLSARSADSAGIKLYSRSLLGIGLTHEQIDRSMRVSFSHHTTVTDVEELVSTLENVIKSN